VKDNTTSPPTVKLPWFPFYPADWLSDSKVASMNLEEQGAYLRLLCFCWREGRIPTDPRSIARLLSLPDDDGARLWSVLEPCFTTSGTNPRLEREREAQQEKRKLRSIAGIAGNEKRWSCDRNAIANGSQIIASQSQSQSQNQSQIEEVLQPFLTLTSEGSERSGKTGARTREVSAPAGFDEFWAAYPKKVGKGDARKAWQKIRPSRDLLEKILEAIESQLDSWQWRRDSGQFIPHPATWLNQSRWEDEPGPSTAPSLRPEEDEWQREKRRLLAIPVGVSVSGNGSHGPSNPELARNAITKVLAGIRPDGANCPK